MTPEELKERCRTAIAHLYTGGKIQLLVPGKYTDSGRKRLFGRSGPWGQCIADHEKGVLVVFDAAEVLRFLEENP